MMIGVKAASRALNCSEAVIRKLVKENAIPHFKISERVVRFDLNEVLRSVKREPQDDARSR